MATDLKTFTLEELNEWLSTESVNGYLDVIDELKKRPEPIAWKRYIVGLSNPELKNISYGEKTFWKRYYVSEEILYRIRQFESEYPHLKDIVYLYSP